MKFRVISITLAVVAAACVAAAAPLGVFNDVAVEMRTVVAGHAPACTRCKSTPPAHAQVGTARALPGTAVTANGSVRADFNGDGRSDLLLSRTFDSATAYWAMSGPQVAAYSPVFTSFNSANRITEDDFNGDGRSDVFVRWGNGGAIAFSNAAGGFDVAAAPEPAPDWTVFGAGDIDGDGKADILLESHFQQDVIAFWIMDSANVVRYSGIFNRPAGAKLVAQGDFNGDRKLDLVWQTGASLSLWIGDGNGFTPAAVRDVADGWQVWGAGDIDGDGRSDLLLTNVSRRYLAYWTMDGARVSRYSSVFRLPGDEALSRRYGPIAVGDYNGDGRLDIVHSRDARQELVMWLGDGVGFAEYAMPSHSPDWRVLRTFNREGAPVRPYVPGDADGDGKAEALVVGIFLAYDPVRQGYYGVWGSDNRTAYFRRRPDGSQPEQVTNAPFAGEPLATGDFDGDARVDIVIGRTESSTGARRTYMRLSSRNGAEAEVQTPAAGWQIIGADDIDGDGRSDLLLGEGVQRAIYGVTTDAYRAPVMSGFAYWVMDGANVSRYSVGFLVDPTTPRLAARGDFNGDGRADLVWSNANGAAANRAQMWLGDGAGFTATPVTAPASGWTIFHGGDVDADGRSDLFLKNGQGIAYWLMDSARIRSYSPGFLIAEPEAMGDYKGDGGVDLIELARDCKYPSLLYIHIGNAGTFSRNAAGYVGDYQSLCGFYQGPGIFPR